VEQKINLIISAASISQKSKIPLSKEYYIPFTFIFIILLIGCGIKTTVLQDGTTRVAVNQKVYKNISKFDTSMVTVIDTTVIYEAYNTLYNENGIPVYKKLARLTTKIENPDNYYHVYRFYNNGCYNLFILDREKDASLGKNDFNPDYAGNRGIYFKEDSVFIGNIVVQKNGIGERGIRKELFYFSGDTLFRTIKNSPYTQIFIKRNVPSDYLKWKATW
jgi:hypothetical protein